MTHVLNDRNRRNVTLFTSKTGEVLPSYYEQDNPKLIQLLDEYYNFLDSSGRQSFSNIISEIHHARDISQTDLDYLDELISEIGNGLTASSFFAQPRLMAKFLSRFYQVKGTVVSAEGFFRGFFNQEASIEYPKNNMFIVNESLIGYESQKFIQDNRRYQIFSILLKVGLATTEYETLYKKFVHPAGWFFAGEVVSETEALIPVSAVGDEAADDLFRTLVSSTSIPIEPVEDTVSNREAMTFLIDSSDGTTLRITDFVTVDDFAGDSVGVIDRFYPTIIDLITPNSFTFDDSSNTAGPDMSMTYETTENDMFTRYLTDITDSSI